jgi:beta-glucuronidase
MRRAAAYLVFFFCLPLFALKGPAPLITNVESRTTISLDGTWNSIVDPYESGLSSRYYLNAKPKSKSDLIEYDFDRSPKLKVPGDWNTQRDSLLLYEGPIWYQRSFTYTKRPHTRTFLYFGAANYLARVWLNGAKLGEHVGGYTPFDFEVTDQIKDGENSVVVEVDNTRHLDAVPSMHTDWWNYGGLTRSVKLIEVPEIFIENYSLQLSQGNPDEIAGWVQLNGAQTDTPVSVTIPALRISQTAETDASGRAVFHFPAKPELWSPEKPTLYGVIIGAGNGVNAGNRILKDNIGFRTIATRGTQILLNGKPVFLRGISAHEEAPFRSGRAFSEEDERILLTWAKELGCNFVRLTHYPHNEEEIRLADEMGLMVWEEVPVYWEIQFQDPAVLENAEAQLHDAIRRDQNRASIVIWSLSNETPATAERTEFLHKMSDYARGLDSTRLISSASDKWQEVDPEHMELNDPLGQYLDVIGLNEYVGWYGNHKPEDADQMQWSFAFKKPVIVTEFGAGAEYGLHGDSDTRFTEEYQANLYRHQLAMLSHISALAGMSPWVLMDFRSPRRVLPGIQDFYNRKGLISDRGQRKQAFYGLQKFYREKAEERQ